MPRPRLLVIKCYEWAATLLAITCGGYCLVLKKAQRSCVLHAAGENFSNKEVALSIHRAMELKGEPKSISLEQARRLTPIAEALTKSHALSADYARSTFGCEPSRGSILGAIEDEAELYAQARR